MLIPAIILFVIGTFFGSFLSVVIYRIHEQKKGIFFGKSECPYCHERLKPRDLIPIISFFIHRGKCRVCKKNISPHYLFLEIITGLVFLIFYIEYTFIEISQFNQIIFNSNIWFLYVFYTIIGIFLIAIWFYDLKYLEIPQTLVIPPIIIILLVSFILPGPGIISMLIGALLAIIFFGIQVWISHESWMGMGDVYVGVLIGLLLGWKYLIICLLFSYIIGSLASMVLLIAGKVNTKSKIPFAPFLVIATFITLFFGDFFYNLYLQTLL